MTVEEELPIKIVKVKYGNILLNAIGNDIFYPNEELTKKLNKAMEDMMYCDETYVKF